jgi:hypothetical protein
MNRFASAPIRTTRLQQPKRTLHGLSQEIRALGGNRDLSDGERLRLIANCEQAQRRILFARDRRSRAISSAFLVLIGASVAYVLPVGLPVFLGAALLVWILQSPKS